MNVAQILRCNTIFSSRIFQKLTLDHVSRRNNLFNRNFSVGKIRFQNPNSNPYQSNIRSTRNYFIALTVTALGVSYAAVPLYRIFCQTSGFGGTVQHDLGGEKVEKMQKRPHRLITIKFNSDVASSMSWKFQPQQTEIVVVPGETALAFYTATNPTDKPIVGISTYNILPFEAGPYFNKIQCFCFEEQLLNPREQVDMPVFFYIDPEFCDDPLMENIDEIILSYTFFEAKEGLSFSFGPHNSIAQKK